MTNKVFEESLINFKNMWHKIFRIFDLRAIIDLQDYHLVHGLKNEGL